MRERAARPINEDGGREKNLEIAVGGLALLLLGAALIGLGASRKAKRR